MREKAPLLLAAALLISLPLAARGAPSRRPEPPPAQTITLGSSAVPLTGAWRFSPGDSPWVNGAFAWAQPGFDDADWTALDLTPKADPLDLEMSPQNEIAGWTARGFPNLAGYAWYRLTIRLDDATQPLALKMPVDFEDAYQVYANGKFAGQFGRFDSSPPESYSAQPVTFTLPAPGADGQITLAIRFYMSPLTALYASDAGGMREAPILATPLGASLIQSHQISGMWLATFGPILTTLLFLLIAPLSLWAWLHNRRELAFLWLFFNLAATIAFHAIAFVSAFTLLTRHTTIFWLYVIISPTWIPGWTMVWWYWFDLRKTRWIPILSWLTVPFGMYVMYYSVFTDRMPGYLSSMTPLRFHQLALPIAVIDCGLLLLVLILGFLRDTFEALLAAVPVFLLEMAVFLGYSSRLLTLPDSWIHIFGITIDESNLASMLLALVVSALFLRRMVQDRVRQGLAHQSLQNDLEQARELQRRVLVPEEVHSNCFSVEIEYHASQTVGGDFFQTLTGLDASLLIVIGDVSGKGISAAMLVAVLVGAARTRASETFDPDLILKTLNQRLIGRSGGHFATCLVAEIRPDGQMRMANAGHLPPYLNGAEIGLEGSLPLGSAGRFEPSSRSLQLRPGDQLTFLTDGVVEARNADGELFGFDRTSALALHSAANIAHAAQEFGQDDDITVLRVHYVGPPIENFSIQSSKLSLSLP